MTTLLHDVRFSLRLLARSPGFAAGAILSVALAIAANVVVFSLVDSILLRPLPVEDPERLVGLHAVDSEGGGFHSFSHPDFLEIREGTPAFEDVLAYDLTPMAWSVGDRAEVVQGFVASDNFFDLLGVDAALGRTFGPNEGEVPGRDAVAVISQTCGRSASRRTRRSSAARSSSTAIPSPSSASPPRASTVLSTASTRTCGFP